MKRRGFLVGLAAASSLAVVAGPAMAASYAEDVIAQLTKLGFSNISVETTWLGRIKIVATRSDGIREIVLNPRTGEILRDVWRPVSGGGVTRNVLGDVDDSGGGHDGKDDDGGDDDGGGHDGKDDDGGDDDGGDDDGKDDGGKDDDGKDDGGKDDGGGGDGGKDDGGGGDGGKDGKDRGDKKD